jgi:four helix bundle protein
MYQRARELTNAVYAVTRADAFARDRGFSDEVLWAAVPEMSNIAEGFERVAVADFTQFLYIAKGPCGEVRAQLQIALDQHYIAAETHGSLTELARRTSGMIANFIAHLQSSEYRGAKFSGPEREAAAAQRERTAAVRKAQLANIRRQSTPPDTDLPSP